MNLPLPNLDDRRWDDLVDEGRALIPLYGRDWTDHNVHDPGITLMELLAWIAEMDIYWLNRVPEAHRRKALGLLGIVPLPPRPARTVLSLQLKAQEHPQRLPAGTQFLAGAEAPPLQLRTLETLTVVPGQIEAVQVAQGRRITDLSARLERGETVALLGEDPAPGATLYVALSEPLRAGIPASLFFVLAGERTGPEERLRIREAAARSLEPCARANPCNEEEPDESLGHPAGALLAHHSVITEWAYTDAHGAWRPLDPERDLVRDETRGFTLSGPVVVRLPQNGAMGKGTAGPSLEPRYLLRCRLRSGQVDVAPRLAHLILNGVAAEQVGPGGSTLWEIVPGADVPDAPLKAGEPATLNWTLDEHGSITALWQDPTAPALTVLAYQAPSGSDRGRLDLAVEHLGAGDGRPRQRLALAGASNGDRPQAQPYAIPDSLQLFSQEAGGRQQWQRRLDLDASRRTDAHYLLDLDALNGAAGVVEGGDGDRGRVFPAGAPLMAAYDVTYAEAGKLRARSPLALARSRHNRALLGDVEAVARRFDAIYTLLPASGGAAPETVDQAAARALQEMARPTRAVTIADFEALARATPGVSLARVAVRPALHPDFPCVQAPGIVTVILLPYLPAGRPVPGSGLKRRVAATLARHRTVGMRIIVTGPRYREVAVRARVQAHPTADGTQVRKRATARLDRFFDPLHGGPEGGGWPFGRDVVRSEILQVLDETPGIEYVEDLELLTLEEGGEWRVSCGNVCLGPLELVAAGAHQVEVLNSQEACDA